MTEPEATAPAERDQLLPLLSSLDLPTAVAPYPAHTTTGERKRLRGDLPDTFTKNLLLRDKKGTLFFVTGGPPKTTSTTQPYASQQPPEPPNKPTHLAHHLRTRSTPT